MEVFRITKESYAGQLHASGVANRWNLDRQNVIYAGGSRSLATLELVVHRSYVLPTQSYKVMVITISEDEGVITGLDTNDLPAEWRSFDAYPALQKLGAEWYNQKQSVVLKVPSAVISKEYNFVINTEHPDFTTKIQLTDIEDYFWDERLL